jgi:hypothetical protein
VAKWRSRFVPSPAGGRSSRSMGPLRVGMMASSASYPQDLRSRALGRVWSRCSSCRGLSSPALRSVASGSVRSLPSSLCAAQVRVSTPVIRRSYLWQPSSRARSCSNRYPQLSTQRYVSASRPSRLLIHTDGGAKSIVNTSKVHNWCEQRSLRNLGRVRAATGAGWRGSPTVVLHFRSPS